MTLEYGGRPDGTRRSKMRIPGGPGDRKQNFKVEDYPDPAASQERSDTLSAEELEGMSDHAGENRDASHSDDLAVLNEMSLADQTTHPLEEEPPTDGTQYDRLIDRAQNSASTSFWNGRRPTLVTKREIEQLEEPGAPTEADEITDKYDYAKDVERARYLEERAERQEEKDFIRNGLRWIMGKGRGRRNEDKRRKKGNRAA